MKTLKMLAVAALVIAPVTAVAAPASAATPAAAGSSLSEQGVNVVSPAGWGTDLSNWFCKHYGISC